MKRYQLTITTILAVTQSAYGTETIVPFIGANGVHAQGITGQGVTVVVIDDGYLPHPSLDGRIEGGIGFENGIPQDDGGVSYSPDNQHGTVVSLVIVDPTGVAPDARILPIRVFDALGGSSFRDVERGIRYAIGRRKSNPSIRIINMSLGTCGAFYTCNCDNDAQFIANLQAAMADAEIEGILSFVSSGNESQCGFINAPACCSSAIAVAASYDGNYDPFTFQIDENCDNTIDFECTDFNPQPNWVTCFSNIDNCNFIIAAPGYDVNVGGFIGWYGTSFAAPVVSGVAALMWSKAGCPGLSAPQARNIIFGTALPFSWAFPFCPVWAPDHINGGGAVNAVPSSTVTGSGDLTCDGTVAGDDFVAFVGCMTGPDGGPVVGFCTAGDFPESEPDGDVDLRDFAQFQLVFTGYGSGACCHLDGTCTEELVVDCAAEFGAVYQGHGTICAEVECPLPLYGACCDVIDGTCTLAPDDVCSFEGGLYQGDGTTCETTDCPVVRYRNVIDPLTAFSSGGPGRMLADDITLSGAGGGQVVFYDLALLGGGGGSFDVTVGLYTNCPGLGGTLIAGTERTFTDNPDFGSPVFLHAFIDPPVTVPNSFWMVVEFSTTQAGWFRAEEAEIGFTENFFGRNDPPWVCNYWFGGSPYAGFWANVACLESTDDGRYSNETDSIPGYVSQQGALALADDMTLEGTGGRELVYYDLLVFGGGGGPFNVTVSLYDACPGAGGSQIPGTANTWTGVPDDGFLYLLQQDLSGSPVTIPDTVLMVASFSNAVAGWMLAGPAEIGFTDDVFGVNVPPWRCNFWFGGDPYAGFWANLQCVAGGALRADRDVSSYLTRRTPNTMPTAIRYHVTRDQLTITDERQLDHRPAGQFVLGQSNRSFARRPDGRSSATVVLDLTSPQAGQTAQPGDPIAWSISAGVSTGDNLGLALISVDLEQSTDNPELIDIPPATGVPIGMQLFDRPDGVANPEPGGAGSTYSGTQHGAAGARNLVQIGGAQNTCGVAADGAGENVDVVGGIGQGTPALVAEGVTTAPDAPGIYTFSMANGLANVLEAINVAPEHSPVLAASVVLNAPSITVVVCRLGDVNLSGTTGIEDIFPFVAALLDPDTLSPTAFCAVDVNQDGNADGLDIQPFVDLLITQ